MDEQFDDSLKNHIRAVFENFEDPTADEGWLLLREKFPEKEKDRPIVWLWWLSAAAVLLLALGIGTWVNKQKNNTETIALKPRKQHQENKDNQLAIKTKKIIPDSVHYNNTFLGKSVPNNKTNTNTQIAKNKIEDKAITTLAAPSNSISKPVINNALADIPPANMPQQTSNNAVTSATPEVDSAVNKPASIAAKQPTKPAKSFTDEKYITKENKTTTPATDNEKKVKFGIYAATYFNYAKGSENQVNVGAGFTSDINLSKKIKLSTGVAIAQNSLNYINQPSSDGLLNNSVFMNGTVLDASALSFTKAATSPVIKNYNATLIGLDIPINIKYEFNPQKSQSFVSIGLSSGTFINESYTYNYNNISTPLSTLQQPQPKTSSNSFTDFYFAKTLNVSFGIGYPLGKKNHLIIEPFLKYPLSGLGSQQIHFGAGGLNLKFDFQSAKK